MVKVNSFVYAKGQTMKTLHINDELSQSLATIAKERGETKQSVINHAIELLVREHFFEKVNQEYAQLHKNKKAWKDELKERRIWQGTNLDGLNHAKARKSPK